MFHIITATNLNDKKKNRNCKLPTSPITGDTSINSIDAKRIKGHFAYL